MNPVVAKQQRKKILSEVNDCCGLKPDVFISNGIDAAFVDGELIEPNSISTGPSIYAEYGEGLKWIIQCQHCFRWVLSYNNFRSKKKLKDAIKDWNRGIDYWHGCQD